MLQKLYWQVYLNLEKELLSIFDIIHVDDVQLNVYSTKIADLLIRITVEIESIAKTLYFSNGGPKPDDKSLYFDTDCMNHLVQLWDIDKKVVLVTCSNLFLSQEANLILTPLHKSHKRGSSSAEWCKAYQAIKHNRAKELKNGNLKNTIRALAALYILNLYLKDETIEYSVHGEILFKDFSFSSKIFSILPPNNIGRRFYDDGKYYKGADFEKHIYVAIPDKLQYQELVIQNRTNNYIDPQKIINLKFTAELNKNQPFLCH